MGAIDAIEWACSCVATTFKMTQWVEQLICIKFCVKLEHSSMGTIRMIQKATTMHNWWLAASSQQHSCSSITFPAEFLAKYQIIQVTQPPYISDLAPCDFWLFPKLLLPLKRKRFQTDNEIQENTMGQQMGIGRTVWGPKVPTLKGTEVSLSYVQFFFNKCLYFS